MKLVILPEVFSYPVKLTPTERFGLLGEFSIEPKFRDADDSTSITRWQRPIGGDFSIANKEAAKPFIKSDMKFFVEIGVSRDKWKESSTKFLLDNLAEDGRYVGIDIEDRKFIEEKDSRAKFILEDSQNVESIVEQLNLKDGEYIDLLLIDGHHSVKYVSREWDYAKYVRPKGGIIILHDTNYHPGPWSLLRAVDPQVFDIYTLCPQDYGIAVLVRK